ncbi:LysR family transcriptional regulator [Ramlibacter sp. WS9]|uniref:LysR family transcriptional regulator n=1 Tax=Ramlibacter sp. WS9 TaxID=1882741 RepID=UPI00114319A2|nr:LysR family transcriptional regulator [Ramlibacter sp. WS9]ROZ79820.1 LysR family transcriptional regulator [Ramlibacter sp. WS9]
MPRIQAPISPPRPRLDIRDLQVVLAVAAARSTSRAAPVLHLSQSAVSRALMAAEDKLGARLFERSVSGFTATPVGERLIATAGPFLAQLAELEKAAMRPAPEPVKVRLVCECYTAYRWLPSALVAMRKSLPDLEVSLAVEHTGDPVAALLAGEVDVALITTSKVGKGLREARLFHDEIVFVLADTHPLARKASITPADLAAQPLISSTHTPPAEQQWFITQLFPRKAPPLQMLHFPLTEAVVDAARAGMGVAAMSEWMAEPYLEARGLVLRRLSTGPLLRPWRIAWRPEAGESAQRLAGALTSLAPRSVGERQVFKA